MTYQETYDITFPRSHTERGRLVFTRGASLVTIAAEPALEDLVRAHFDGPTPHVSATNGVVTVRYPRLSLAQWARYALLWGRDAASIMLSASVPWGFEFHRGITKLDADMRTIHLTEVTVFGGASEVLIQLPRPEGIVPVRILGGASKVTVQHPRHTAAVLKIHGGASQLAFDSQFFGSASGPMRFETAGSAQATDRYEIEIGGGASQLSVEER